MRSGYKLLPHYTYDDYCRWEGQWEIIDGIPYAMSPQPGPEHQRIAGSLHAEFRAAIKRKGCDCQVYQPVDYKISEDTILNPDLLILCQPVEKAFVDFPPKLVAEILSPSTALKDRHTKFQLYEQEKIPYYLIVDIEKKQVEVYQFLNSRYAAQSVNSEQPFSFSFDNCRFDVDFAAVWD